MAGEEKRTYAYAASLTNVSSLHDQPPLDLYNKELLALIDKHKKNVQNISGLRIVYFNSKLKTDHEHNEEWSKALCKPETGCLEAGTITEISTENDLVIVRVCWDCGVGKTYAPELWCYLRVYSLGPTGYLGQMVFCDKCLEPSRGLAFRLARENMSVGDLYDLCYVCYNECDDEHMNSCFHCNIPSGNIDLDSGEKVPLSPRENSRKYVTLGLFPQAVVEFELTSDTTDPTNHGEILNIVHEQGNYDLRKAKYYDSSAEVKKLSVAPSKSGSIPLTYKEAGSGGKVELKAIKPGKAPSPMPVEHYPTLGIEILEQMLTYKGKLVKINEGKENESSCFMRFKDGGCYSLTISGTRLTSITDPTIWERCKDLKIVILFINELSNLPEELKHFSDTIELVCIQHNRFTEVPPVIFSLKHIKHLNLHGNKISKFPEEMKVFSNLERLKFGQNKLYSLPNIFESFTHSLIEITLNDNYLTRLPPSFAELKQLESIDLRDNSFTCIPAPLLKLPKLKVLYMDWNRIQRLAPIEDHEGRETFALLRRLVSLRLSGNPVHEQLRPRLDSSSILKLVTDWTVFSELHQHPVYRALRVLVLGSCGAGKTSIVEALSFKKYVTPTSEAHHDHTVGIKQFSIPVRMKMKNGKEITTELRLWDFAGERSYIMMNSLFVTDGTLVWIAVNFQRYECTNDSFHENVTSWLEQVMTRSIRPVVWVIGTHTDKCTQEEVEKKLKDIKDRIKKKCKLFHTELKKELDKLKVIEKDSQYKNRSPDCVRRNISELETITSKNTPCFIQDHLKVICLTNTHSFKGFDDLKDYIECFPQCSPFENLTAPLTVSEQKAADKLRQETEEILASGEVPVLENEKVIKIIKCVLGSDSNDEEAKQFLQYLYQVGQLLVCKPHSDIILDVAWLIDLLAQIFHHNFRAMVNEKKSTFIGWNDEDNIEHAVSTQQATGIVEKPLLEALWPLAVEIFNRLVQLLETYGLAYETAESPGPSGYLFPWLVTKTCLEPVPLENEKKEIFVSYDFLPCLPPCFLQQLAVKCKKHHPVKNVFTNSFTVSASKVLNPDNQLDFTTLRVYVFVSSEKNKMCGKINLCACVQSNTATDSALLIDLWKMLMTIIKEMEGLLCYWTFYGNLQRKVYCPKCFKIPYHLEIRKWGEKKDLEPCYECRTCGHTTAPIYVRPPNELLLQEYVDKDVDEHPGSHSSDLQHHRSTSEPKVAQETTHELGSLVSPRDKRTLSSHPSSQQLLQTDEFHTAAELAGNRTRQFDVSANADLSQSEPSSLSRQLPPPVEDTHDQRPQ